MRGPDDQTNGMFSYLSPEQRVRQDHPLRAIRRLTDEVLASLSLRFRSSRTEVRSGPVLAPPSARGSSLAPETARRSRAVDGRVLLAIAQDDAGRDRLRRTLDRDDDVVASYRR